MAPSLSFENTLWKTFDFVAGCDEVGRGALAGPVTVGVVIFAKGTNFKNVPRIDDSKKLRPGAREEASEWIKENALAFATASVSARQIDTYGIVKATQKAFRQALAHCRRKKNIPIQWVLLDAFHIPYIPNLPKKRQTAIIHGDALSMSIAAASIIAKVERDAYMSNVAKKKQYKKYGWDENKGYGTQKHRDAMKKYGITGFHRKTFVLASKNGQNVI